MYKNLIFTKTKHRKKGGKMETNNNNIQKPNPTKKGESKKVIAVNSRKNRASSTVAIVTLSILLGLSLVLGLTAAFFSASQTATGTVTLGDPVNINITQGGTNVTALTFAGTALPGTSYTQPIGISVPANTSKSVLRCKLSLTNEDATTTDITATTSDKWTLGEDGYYYYNGSVEATNTVDFCTAITVPKSLTNTSANKVYTVTFQVEAIQYANGAASEVWTTAPEKWTTTYGTGA